MSLKKVSLIFLGFAVLQDEVGENIRKCERKTVTVMHDKVALISVLLKISLGTKVLGSLNFEEHIRIKVQLKDYFSFLLKFG